MIIVISVDDDWLKELVQLFTEFSSSCESWIGIGTVDCC